MKFDVYPFGGETPIRSSTATTSRATSSRWASPASPACHELFKERAEAQFDINVADRIGPS